MTEGVKRVYRSEARQAAAAESRQRVLDAAAELFVSRGYPGTTLKEVAELAGVGERTVYDKFGDKLQLYKQTVRYRTRGDDQPIPHPERPATLAVFEAEDPHEIIELHMSYGSQLMERAADLIMVGVAASGADRDLEENYNRSRDSVYGIHLKVTKHLHALGHLKPDLDPGTAADMLYAITGPATFQMLRRHRRWSLARYHRWLVETGEQQLLKSE
ncbi:MAG TPA: helix-turn-helix domain-containing protein [Nocardioidaceae bacterium]|nr:helix-turn-helix domain-containing protein [Nocardioidaceae bacterium]